MKEETFLTVDDCEQYALDKFKNCDDSKEAKDWADAAATFHEAKSKDIAKEEELLNDNKKRKGEFLVGVFGALAMFGGPVVVQIIRNVGDLDWLFWDWEQSKTENVISRHNLHRRLK